ncbi:MAG TPA: hypothetical protein ENN87_01745 [Phycisphaerales bacterium]|nr:hypothetical protein [Phycisphaerales bacterium]
MGPSATGFTISASARQGGGTVAPVHRGVPGRRTQAGPLRRAEAKSDIPVEAWLAPAGYVAVCRDGVIRQISETAARLLGRRGSDLLDVPLASCVQPHGRAVLQEHLRRVFAGHVDTVQLTFSPQAGKPFLARLCSQPLSDAGGPGGYCLCTVIDLVGGRARQARWYECRRQLRQIERRIAELQTVCAQEGDDVLRGRALQPTHARRKSAELDAQRTELRCELREIELKLRLNAEKQEQELAALKDRLDRPAERQRAAVAIEPHQPAPSRQAHTGMQHDGTGPSRSVPSEEPLRRRIQDYGQLLRSLRAHLAEHQRARKSLEIQRDELTHCLTQLMHRFEQDRVRFAREIGRHKQVQQQLVTQRESLRTELAAAHRRVEELREQLRRQHHDETYLRRLEQEIARLQEQLAAASTRSDSSVDGTAAADLQGLLAERTEDLETLIAVVATSLHGPVAELARRIDELEAICHRQALHNAKTVLKPVYDQLVLIGEVVEALRQLGDVRIEEADELNVNLIVADILAENPLWRKTGVAFQIESLPSCAGDALQIKRVFEAMLDNAVKFRRKTRDAYVRIGGRRDGDLTVYCIEDNGRGMAAADLDRAFGMFTKLDPAGTPGRGVGLAVAKRIVEAHQGRITVETQPGVGSRFFLHLPRRPEILTRSTGRGR